MQPVWYTEEGTPDWKPGLIDGKDLHPDSYWVITDKNTRVHRNIQDIKPRVPVEEPHPTRVGIPEMQRSEITPSPGIVPDPSYHGIRTH